MAVIEINWHPTNRELRTFAVIQWIVLTIVAWQLYRSTLTIVASLTVCGIAIAGLIAGMIRPQCLRRFYVSWMVAAFPMGWVVSHLLLAVVYFGVLTPIALLLRLQGSDPLQLKGSASTESYWIRRSESPESSRYFRQF